MAVMNTGDSELNGEETTKTASRKTEKQDGGAGDSSPAVHGSEGPGISHPEGKHGTRRSVTLLRAASSSPEVRFCLQSGSWWLIKEWLSLTELASPDPKPNVFKGKTQNL